MMIHQKTWFLLLGFLYLALIVTSCSDDPASTDPDEGGLENASNPIAVVLEAQGGETIGANMAAGGKHITICYADGECDNRSAGGSQISGSADSIQLLTSNENKTVVGISANIDITGDEGGAGMIVVTEIDEEQSDGSLTEFFRSDVAQPGDEVNFELGEIDEE